MRMYQSPKSHVHVARVQSLPHYFYHKSWERTRVAARTPQFRNRTAFLSKWWSNAFVMERWQLLSKVQWTFQLLVFALLSAGQTSPHEFDSKKQHQPGRKSGGCSNILLCLVKSLSPTCAPLPQGSDLWRKADGIISRMTSTQWNETEEGRKLCVRRRKYVERLKRRRARFDPEKVAPSQNESQVKTCHDFRSGFALPLHWG